MAKKLLLERDETIRFMRLAGQEKLTEGFLARLKEEDEEDEEGAPEGGDMPPVDAGAEPPPPAPAGDMPSDMPPEEGAPVEDSALAGLPEEAVAELIQDIADVISAKSGANVNVQVDGGAGGEMEGGEGGEMPPPAPEGGEGGLPPAPEAEEEEEPPVMQEKLGKGKMVQKGKIKEAEAPPAAAGAEVVTEEDAPVTEGEVSEEVINEVYRRVVSKLRSAVKEAKSRKSSKTK